MALLQGFHPQGILEYRAAEDLGREVRHGGKREPLSLGKRIADVDCAVIVQAHDVAGIGFRGVRARQSLTVDGGLRLRRGFVPHVVHASSARVTSECC